MEASPRDRFDGEQRRLDEGEESVRALGDRILIERLTVADERAARVVRERAEAGTAPAESVAKAIEIGARVIDSEATAANVDYVQRVFEERVGRLHDDLSGTLEEGSAEIARRIADRFDVERADSVQGEIKEMLTAAARIQQEQLHRALTAEDGPLTAVQQRTVKQVLEAEDRHRKQLTDLREAHAKEARALGESHSKEARRLQGEIAGLKEQISVFVERAAGEEAVAAAEEAGTRKGFGFEERVNDAVERIASLRGDCATHTGAEGAEGGGKKGDTLVEIGAGSGPASGRIVFESKDSKLSKNQAWKELDDAMAARAASFGVLVVAGEERIPAGREPLHEYEGNKLIVAVDRDEPDGPELALAYRLALARVAMARDRNLTVDAGEVRAAAEEALSCLKQAQKIRTALTGIKTSSDKARDGLDAMVDAVEEKLERIDSLVAEAADEGDGTAAGAGAGPR